jgi:hypothetical protein
VEALLAACVDQWLVPLPAAGDRGEIGGRDDI